MGINPFRINIVGLSNKAHSFQFDLDEGFFVRYGQELISGGSFHAEVVLDKHETFINATFSVTGNAQLVCDRTLDPFDFPVVVKEQLVFKYGEEEKELSDEVIIITHKTDSIDIGQLIYEFIILQVPIRKVHPRFKGGDEDADGNIIYRSSVHDDEGMEDNSVDPRWEQLKKLK
jgi:uncharacterized metal-binding protein YceD (DUF177 family)